MTSILRAIIVDDEPLAIERLTILLRQFPAVELIGAATSGAEAITLAAATKPDLCLLDLAIPDMSGIEIAQALALQPNPPLVIFVTAFSHFAVAAFGVAAIDYVLKPADPERLAAAIERARRYNSSSVRQASLPTRLSDFWVSGPHGLSRLPACEVSRITAERDYMRLHAGGRSWLIDDSLARLDEVLDPDIFLRVHRGAILNRTFVVGLRTDERGWVARLTDGSEQRIGRSFADRVRLLRDQRLH